jgi:3-oxoacyl-[acyl-carrier-protein] synthase II
MSAKKTIAVTGMGLEIPGWQNQSFLEILEKPVTYGEFNPRELLGKKGLRYKDRATLLSLCAVHRALDDRGLLELEKEQRAGFGVCVSSNLGNMDTVCAQSEVIHAEQVDATSPMSLPVASSNVIPASIAMRFGFKAMNLMLCNGATSGVDALYIAAKMLQSGRAEKMVVVGVEPLNDTTERMLAECDPETRSGPGLKSGELAACVILEPAGDDPSATVYGTLGEYEFIAPGADARIGLARPAAWFVPAQTTERSRSLVANAQAGGFSGVPVLDVSSNTGELYGALGVFQALIALSHLRRSGGKQALLSNGFTFGDGLSSIQIAI